MKDKLVLAYSGGLDTSYCVAWLAESGYAVHAVTVNTGGFDADALTVIGERARALGAVEHKVIDARAALFDRCLRYLIFANALRGEVYPLCVSAERLEQARACAEYAAAIGAAAVAHGSTGAGNDQIRFDTAFRVFAPDAELLAPIRAQGLSREAATAYLAARGVEIGAKATEYSVNRGMWGATIGGKETHSSEGVLPEGAYTMTAGVSERPRDPEGVEVVFRGGVPVAIDGHESAPVSLIGELNWRAGRHGVGRGMHVGDTIPGIKGRVAFEAPAAVTLIAAHRELEKLVLSRQQQFWKRTLGEVYGAAVHEARLFDPLMRDLEVFLESSQRRVSGTVRVQLHQGMVSVLGARSPYSMLGAQGARYGEEGAGWDGADAAGFAKLYALPDVLLHGIGDDHG